MDQLQSGLQQLDQQPYEMSHMHALEQLDQQQMAQQIQQIAQQMDQQADHLSLTQHLDGSQQLEQLPSAEQNGDVDQHLSTTSTTSKIKKKRSRDSISSTTTLPSQTVIPPGLDFNKKQGRPFIPFSQAKKKGSKLKKLDEKIIELAGGEKEKELILQAYRESSYARGLFSDTEESETLEKVGLNAIKLIHELPPMSPLRQPLIQALGKDIGPAQLRRAMNVSQSTIKRAKTIKLEDSLLFTLRYKPGVTREKRIANNGREGDPIQDIVAQLENGLVNSVGSEEGGYSQQEIVQSLGAMSHHSLGHHSHSHPGSHNHSGMVNLDSATPALLSSHLQHHQ